MPTFQSKPYRQSKATSAINHTLRRHPFATFGLPFLTIMVIASFGLSTFTQTKYDRADGKVRELDKKEQLQIQKNKKPVDLREEYFRLQSKDHELENWENKRIRRDIAGLDEWNMPLQKK
ncbi:hypothetical protein E3P99_00592 [Wallemia hederae]|uniref:Cytochrome c oxidase assembly protein COX16, mitochondrial n=1 Tax=Wallemia hederae TaxID=1540922 RepID=A0A4T0FV46_9BASI|nr:hypothetical protein E3P99_00592 [Wallemia hederae]